MHFASYFSRCSSLFFLFCLANGYCLAQFNLSGTVIDRAKGTPVEAVHVFLENTTLGTLTDEQGRYEFKEIPNGVYKLIVSHLAYNTVDMTVRTPRRTPYILDFKLFPSSIDLSAVEVTSKKSRKRNRYLKEFTSAILGNTPNGAKCRLLNPEQVLLQKEADGRLTASAKGILKFENKSTGYITYFLLEDFASINNQISYAGKTFFEALESSDPKEARRWAKNRKVTFQGSVRHFYLSLMQNRLTQDGFEIYKAKLQDNKKFVTTGRVDPKQLIKQNGDNYQLQFDDFLKVVYTREGEIDHAGSRRIGRSAKQLSQRAESDLVDQESGSLGQKRKKQTSWLFARKSKIDISPEGFPTKPGSVVEYGYWNEEGLADFLPLEYSPKAATIVAATDVPAEEQPAPERNGFQLTQLKIPLADIQSGGPPRDGIPSIDRPSFIGASDIGNVLRKD
ncbi:MAG: carboxypeptidase-like regulatory domain-containing protein [Bacteroidota bacterium]